MDDPTTTLPSNGHDPSGGTTTTPRRTAPASTPAPPTRPTDGRGKELPDKTKVDLDLSHRVMVEEFTSWYYPESRKTADEIVMEMVALAWAVAEKDQMRPEMAEDRRRRLVGGK